MKAHIAEIIDKLQLSPHPEGGYFKEIYRSTGIIPEHCLPKEFEGDRNFATSIYFLLTSDTFSAFHKINQDETWHFYKGASITLHMISPKGNYKTVIIGNAIEKQEFLQFTVLAGYWFAATVNKENSFSLLGCTVAPGFDFDDFVLAKRLDLIELFPQHTSIITKLTRV